MGAEETYMLGREHAPRRSGPLLGEADTQAVGALDPSVHEPHSAAPLPEASAAGPGADPATVLARVRVATDGRPLQEIPLTIGTIIVGRRADNDVQIDSPAISRHHCQVITTAHSCVIEDLNSTNGIYVQSTRVRRHQLNDGDVVLIGEHELIYVDERARRGGTAVSDTRAASTGAGEPRPRADRRWIWATACGAIVLSIWAYWHAGTTRAPQLLTAQVMRGHIENAVLASGVLQPYEFVDVGAQVSGQLKHLHVKLGDTVKQGQLLAEIDPVISASRVVEAEATLADLQAQRDGKKAQLELARIQKERNDELLAQGAAAASESEIANSNYKVQRASLAALDAQIKEVQAALETARANLGYTRITAPMAGDVVSISAREGQTLNANQTTPTVLRVGELGTMTVWALVPEADIPHLRPGQEVYFTILGQGDHRRYGKLRQILPSPEIISNVVFYDALFDIKNPQRELKVQMTAQVFFVLDQADDALYVPLPALAGLKSGQTGEATVRVLKDNGRIEKRIVKVGIRNLVAAQILAGLDESDTVVVGQADPMEKHDKAAAVRKVTPR